MAKYYTFYCNKNVKYVISNTEKRERRRKEGERDRGKEHQLLWSVSTNYIESVTINQKLKWKKFLQPMLSFHCIQFERTCWRCYHKVVITLWLASPSDFSSQVMFSIPVPSFIRCTFWTFGFLAVEPQMLSVFFPLLLPIILEFWIKFWDYVSSCLNKAFFLSSSSGTMLVHLQL